MKIKTSAGELAYLVEEISRLSPANTECTLEVTDGEPERNLENEVRQIMLEKFKRISQIEFEIHMTITEYTQLCSVMNEIAKTLLDK